MSRGPEHRLLSMTTLVFGTLSVLVSAAALPAEIIFASSPGPDGDEAATENAGQKASVPDAQAQDAAGKVAREIYASRYRTAKTVADTTALAAEMITAALKFQDGSADQYVLLRIARDVAARTGDSTTAIRATAELVQRFDVPAARLKGEALLNAADGVTTPAQHKELAELALDLIPELVASDEYDIAATVCKVAHASAQQGNHDACAAALAAEAEKILNHRTAARDYSGALAALDEDPIDPAANLVAGRYLAFVKGEWEQGIEMLALGSDPGLKAVAVMDLRGATLPEEQVKIADAWWALAEAHSFEEEDLRFRAAFWYRQAWANLPTGLARMRAKLRLDEWSQLTTTGTSEDSASPDGANQQDETAHQASSLIAEAQKLIDQQDPGEARKKLLQAVNQQDDDAPQALFYLGLLAALSERDTSEARKYFIRAQVHDTENIACLNNVAITLVRDRDPEQAVTAWSKCIDLGSSPEVHHNVEVLLLLAERNRVALPVNSRQELLKNRADMSSDEVRLSEQTASSRYRISPRSSGWCYMDALGQSAGSSGWHWPSLVDRTCMHCNGVGTLQCPVRNCSRGVVRVSTVDTIYLPGGHVVKKQRLVPMKCDQCNGTGRVKCPLCTDGIDRDL